MILERMYEIARILEHSFQYHRRRQLTEMSIEAKLRRLSILIRDNLPMAMQGIGAVIPIFAIFDQRDATVRGAVKANLQSPKPPLIRSPARRRRRVPSTGVGC